MDQFRRIFRVSHTFFFSSVHSRSHYLGSTISLTQNKHSLFSQGGVTQEVHNSLIIFIQQMKIKLHRSASENSAPTSPAPVSTTALKLHPWSTRRLEEPHFHSVNEEPPLAGLHQSSVAFAFYRQHWGITRNITQAFITD